MVYWLVICTHLNILRCIATARRSRWRPVFIYFLGHHSITTLCPARWPEPDL